MLPTFRPDVPRFGDSELLETVLTSFLSSGYTLHTRIPEEAASVCAQKPENDRDVCVTREAGIH